MFYCPKCAAQNQDDARFCRVCGADVHLVPMALTAQELPATTHDQALTQSTGGTNLNASRARTGGFEKGIEQVVMGVCIMLISAAVWWFVPSGRFWFFWLLIPAFLNLARGISKITLARHYSQHLSPYRPAMNEPSASSLESPPPVKLFDAQSPRNTSEMKLPPPSIAEGTTRHLDAVEIPRAKEEQR